MNPNDTTQAFDRFFEVATDQEIHRVLADPQPTCGDLNRYPFLQLHLVVDVYWHGSPHLRGLKVDVYCP